jgi:hypothetical protein
MMIPISLVRPAFGPRFKPLYVSLRTRGYPPANAFEAALWEACKELRYKGWPPPPEWITEATAIATAQDGDAFEESRRLRDGAWRMFEELGAGSLALRASPTPPGPVGLPSQSDSRATRGRSTVGS